MLCSVGTKCNIWYVSGLGLGNTFRVNMTKGTYYLIRLQQRCKSVFNCVVIKNKTSPSRKSHSHRQSSLFKACLPKCSHYLHLKTASTGTGLLVPQVSHFGMTLRSFWNANRLPHLSEYLRANTNRSTSNNWTHFSYPKNWLSGTRKHSGIKYNTTIHLDIGLVTRYFVPLPMIN